MWPLHPRVARGEAANARVAIQPATDVRRAKPHFERWERRLRGRWHGVLASDQYAIDRAADEGVARVRLLLCDPTSRLVRRGDWGGPTDDRGYAGIWVVPAFRAVADFAGAVRAGELLHDRCQFVVRAERQSGHLRGHLKSEAGVGVYRMH